MGMRHMAGAEAPRHGSWGCMVALHDDSRFKAFRSVTELEAWLAENRGTVLCQVLETSTGLFAEYRDRLRTGGEVRR